MQPVLPDSTLCIAALRRGEDAVFVLRQQWPHGPLWLSAVVLEELYAGSSRGDRHVIERMEHEFHRLGRILVPTLDDWTLAGKTLARLAIEYGYEEIGRGRLTNDALIAMSAARQGITIVTANERDFARLARIRPFQYEVMTI